MNIDVAEAIVNTISSAIDLLRTTVFLVVIAFCVSVYLHGFQHLLTLDKETIQVTIGNLIVVSFMVMMTWSVLKRMLVPHWYNPAAQGAIVASAIMTKDLYLTKGRKLSDKESREMKCIPREAEKIALEQFANQLSSLTEQSEIHDVKIAKLLGLKKTINATNAPTNIAKDLLYIRYGGVRSSLKWDIDLKQSDDAWVCTLKTRENETEEYKPVEKTRANYAPVAIILAVIRRETRLWLSRN
jgi:hypothetical protein